MPLRSGYISASNDPDPHSDIQSACQRAAPDRVPKMAEMVTFYHKSNQRLLASTSCFITAVWFLVSNGINSVDNDNLVGDTSA